MQRVSERRASDAEFKNKAKARSLIHARLPPSVQMRGQDQDASGIAVVKGDAGELISKSTTNLVTGLGSSEDPSAGALESSREF
jgi:hypothetical protein